VDENQLPENKAKRRFYSIAVPVGILSIVWEIFIYRQTFIEFKLLIGIILGLGLVAAVLDYKSYRRAYSLRGYNSFFYSFLTNISIWGFTICTLFITTNYYFRNQNSRLIEYPIIEKTTQNGHQGSTLPVFIITHKGLKKNIIFNDTFLEKKKSFKSIELKIQNGFWGFDVFTEKKLK
jgi:hypothetical protein